MDELSNIKAYITDSTKNNRDTSFQFCQIIYEERVCESILIDDLVHRFKTKLQKYILFSSILLASYTI